MQRVFHPFLLRSYLPSAVFVLVRKSLQQHYMSMSLSCRFGSDVFDVTITLRRFHASLTWRDFFSYCIVPSIGGKKYKTSLPSNKHFIIQVERAAASQATPASLAQPSHCLNTFHGATKHVEWISRQITNCITASGSNFPWADPHHLTSSALGLKDLFGFWIPKASMIGGQRRRGQVRDDGPRGSSMALDQKSGA